MGSGLAGIGLNPVQVILTGALVVLALFALSSRRSQRTQAAKKLAFVALAVASILAVLFPSLVQKAANTLGVGRGTDLVLYVALVVFAYVGVDTYLRFQDLESHITELTRQVALLEARLQLGPNVDSMPTRELKKPPIED